MRLPVRAPLVALAAALIAGSVAPARAATPARPRSHPVFVDDIRVDPADLRARLGDRVVWLYAGAVPRDIVEPRFGLFATPFPLLTGGSHQWVANAAGTIRYEVRLPFTSAVATPATVRVAPMLVRATSTGFAVRWAGRGPLPRGLRFEVQYGVRSGTKVAWRTWTRSTALRATTLPLTCNGRARAARVRIHSSAHAVSGWSPATPFVACT